MKITVFRVGPLHGTGAAERIKGIFMALSKHVDVELIKVGKEKVNGFQEAIFLEKIPKKLPKRDVYYFDCSDFVLRYGRSGRKIWWDIHNVHSRVYPWSEAYYLAIEKFSSEVSDLVTVTSKIDEEYIRKMYGIKPIVLPNGIDTKEIKFVEKIGKWIIFVGNLDYYPNLNGIVWFSKELAKKSATKVHVAGRGKILVKNIIHHGYVSELNDFLANARVAVAPLFEGGGTRLKILLYLAAGIPVVATSTALEGIEDLKRFVYVAEKEEFVKKVLEIYESPPSLKKRIEQRKYIEKHYDWESIVESNLDNILSVLGG